MIDRSSFENAAEAALGKEFLDQGYIIAPVEKRRQLDRIQNLVARTASKFLDKEAPVNGADFLNSIHKWVPAEKLNELRLAVINGLRVESWFRPAYFSLARDLIYTLVGNELAMQRSIGLSVQLPSDDSSLLAVHADVWDGDSSFEIVEWLPLVDCFDTKSMFILSPNKDREIQVRLQEFAGKTTEDLYRKIEKDVQFLDVPYGSVLIFSQTLMHGNRINRTEETRWSLNCRFKSLLSPYADKKLGEFFEPITLKPVTRLALGYKLPEGFNEGS